MSNKILLVRRVGYGIGGAAKILRRYESLFAEEWATETMSAGSLDGKITGDRGPSWWRCLSFSRTVNAALSGNRHGLVFTLERGIKADLFFTADGVHRRYLAFSGVGPLKRLANPLHAILPRLERITYDSVSRIVCQCEMMAEHVATEYPEHVAKIRIIPTGCDLVKFKPHPEGRSAAKREAGLSEHGRLFLFVGSGWKIKNLRATLRLFAEYSAAYDKNARLLIAGTGKPSKYASLIDELGIKNSVSFLGQVSDVAALMRAADALLMPSLYDTFPNAAIEAAACGCPIVVTETNGAREFARERGLVLPLNFDPRAEALRLDELLKKNLSPEAVAETVNRLTLENEKRLYLELFAEILAEKRVVR